MENRNSSDDSEEKYYASNTGILRQNHTNSEQEQFKYSSNNSYDSLDDDVSEGEVRESEESNSLENELHYSGNVSLNNSYQQGQTSIQERSSEGDEENINTRIISDVLFNRIFPIYPDLFTSKIHMREYFLIPKSQTFDNARQYNTVMFALYREEFFGQIRSDLELYFNDRSKIKELSSLVIYEDFKLVMQNEEQKVISNSTSLKIKVSVVDTYHNYFIIEAEEQEKFMTCNMVFFVHRTKPYWFVAIVEDRKCLEGPQQRQKVIEIELSLQLNDDNYIEILKEIIKDDFNQQYDLFESQQFWFHYQKILESLQQIEEQKLWMDSSLQNKLHRQILKGEQPFFPEYNQFRERPLPEGERNIQTRKNDYQQQIRNTIFSFDNKDEKQLQCMQFILENNMAIVQGPPGTGKSYICRQALKVLRRHYFKSKTSKPILVICKRNETVDSFLSIDLVDTRNQVSDYLHISGHSEIDNEINYRIEKEVFDLSEVLRLGYRTKNKDLVGQFEVNPEVLIVKRKSQKPLINEINALLKELSKIQFNNLQKCINKLEESFKEFDIAPDDFFENIFSKLFFNYFISEPSMRTVPQQVMTTKNKNIILNEWTCNSLSKLNSLLIKVGILVSNEQIKIQYVEKVKSITEDVQNIMSIKNKKLIEFVLEDTESEFMPDEIELTEEFLDKMEAKKIRMVLANKIKQSFEQLNSLSNLTALHLFSILQFYLLVNRHQLLLSLKQKLQIAQKKKERLEQQKLIKKLELLQSKKLILSTLTNSHIWFEALYKLQPEIIIIDEAAELMENELSHIMALKPKHIIQVGDHLQLCPLLSNKSLKFSFNAGSSMFLRLIEIKIEFQTLEMQWRMTKELEDYVKIFYEGIKYTNYAAVQSHEITHQSSDVMFLPHTYPETTLPGTTYTINIFEAFACSKIAARYIQKFYIRPDQITILSFYKGQNLYIQEIFQQFYPQQKDVQFSTVDGYQGKENDVIILSCVRSNNDKKIGFLNSKNRINVALSRAKKVACLIGNFEMFSSHQEANQLIWKQIISLSKRQNGYWEDRQLDYIIRIQRTFEEYNKQFVQKSCCCICQNKAHLGVCNNGSINRFRQDLQEYKFPDIEQRKDVYRNMNQDLNYEENNSYQS